MPAILDLPAEQALEFESAAIASFEQMIRRLHADRYRSVQRARELATDDVVGVTASSTARDRDLATRSFVAELATTLGRHEASAARLVAEAERLTGPRVATLDALDAGEVAPTQVRSVLELTRGAPAEVADAVERVALDAAAAAVADASSRPTGDADTRTDGTTPVGVPCDRERPSPQPGGDGMSRKPLRCRLGLHRWVVHREPDVDPYFECARCSTVKVDEFRMIGPDAG